MSISLLEPSWLLLLLFAPLPMFLPARALDRRHALLRGLALACVALALSRPVWQAGQAPSHHVVILDRSLSVPRAEQERAALRARALLDAAPADARTTLLELGGADAAPPLAPGRAPDARLVLARAGSRSPLAAALGAAARAIPAGARGGVSLLSDGRATDLGWSPAVTALQARGIPVDTHALALPGGDVVVLGLEPVGELRVGHSGRVAARLEGDGQLLDLLLSGPDGALAELRGVAVDGPTRVLMEFEPERAGFMAVRLQAALVAGSDARSGDLAVETTLAVQDPLRTLYLGGRQEGGAEQLAALLGPGFELEQVSADDGTEGEHALDVDLVLLDDRPAQALPGGFQRALVDAVHEEGVGLLAAGGRGAFGPGGWHDTPLAELLPVEAVQKEEKRDPSTTLVVIIDTSGSMGGGRVELAKEVARLAIRRLLPHDKVGLVEFYGAKRWAAPIQPASNAIEIERALNRLNAEGGTVILPAIEEAYYALKNVRTRFRHVLVLTDGGVERGSFEPLVRRMSSEGITVSTVLVGGAAHSEFLVSIANWGKGRFYGVPNRFNLPEVLLKQPDSALLPGYRPGVHPVRARGGPGWWGEVDPLAVPPLDGYVETRARAGAQVLLETEQGGHPVLATWGHGLGRVTAMTTEPVGAGSAGWGEWVSYGAALARVLARTSALSRAPFAFSLEREGSELRVRAERRRSAAGEPRVELLDPDAGAPRELELRPVTPDVWSARALLDPAREARLLAGARDGRGGRTRLCSPANAGESGELQVDPARRLDLRALAASTGGRHRVAGEDGVGAPSLGGGPGSVDVRELAPILLGLALCLYLLDLLYRRSTRWGGLRP